MISIKVLSSEDIDEESAMHSKSDNIEIMINDKADEVIEEIFSNFFLDINLGFQTSIKGSDFVFSFAHLLYYKCHQINPNCRRLYRDSLEWMKNKRQQ